MVATKFEFFSRETLFVDQTFIQVDELFKKASSLVIKFE